MRCSRCGAENRAGARFCDACGAALAETSSGSAAPSAAGAVDVRVNLQRAGSDLPEGERKTVTALFADIKDSMELMRDLDPEEARAIIDPALKIMVDAVRRYDGYGAPRRREKEALMGS
jgi:class 3 adenylate cyclase